MPEVAASPPNPVEQLRGILQKLAGMDYYQILGVANTADTDEIKKRFYERSKKYHPDRYRTVEDPAMAPAVTAVYKQISEAYNVLKDPRQRREYDTGLAENRAENLRYDPLRQQQKTKEYDGGSGPGAKYYKLAKQAVVARNGAVARNNIKLALSLEPKNEQFLQLKQEIEARG